MVLIVAVTLITGTGLPSVVRRSRSGNARASVAGASANRSRRGRHQTVGNDASAALAVREHGVRDHVVVRVVVERVREGEADCPTRPLYSLGSSVPVRREEGPR